MPEYRLHIDIPLGNDEDKAIEVCTKIMSSVILPFDNDITQINYRLGHDDEEPDADGISGIAYNDVFVGSSPTRLII